MIIRLLGMVADIAAAILITAIIFVAVFAIHSILSAPPAPPVPHTRPILSQHCTDTRDGEQFDVRGDEVTRLSSGDAIMNDGRIITVEEKRYMKCRVMEFGK